MRILYNGCVSRRTPPRNFRAEDAPLFAHELERTIDPMRALELANISANGEGLLFKQGRVLRESFAAEEMFARFRRLRSSSETTSSGDTANFPASFSGSPTTGATAISTGLPTRCRVSSPPATSPQR